MYTSVHVAERNNSGKKVRNAVFGKAILIGSIPVFIESEVVFFQRGEKSTGCFVFFPFGKRKHSEGREFTIHLAGER